jgi:hypothetical protein
MAKNKQLSQSLQKAAMETNITPKPQTQHKPHHHHHHHKEPKEPKPTTAHSLETGKGAQMMQKMGWKMGEGIGKQNTKTSLIDVEMRPERAGLGSYETTSPSNVILPSDTYQEAARKRARQRFENASAAQQEEEPENKRPSFS